MCFSSVQSNLSFKFNKDSFIIIVRNIRVDKKTCFYFPSCDLYLFIPAATSPFYKAMWKQSPCSLTRNVRLLCAGPGGAEQQQKEDEQKGREFGQGVHGHEAAVQQQLFHDCSQVQNSTCG